MQNVQLKFDSIRELWRFKEEIGLTNFEIRQPVNILFCQLPELAIEKAISHFGAHRIEERKTLNQS